MLPRWHIFWGFVFTVVISIIFREINWIYLSLIFLSSVFIDFDHYLVSVIKSKKGSLFDSFEYHRIKNIQGEKEKERGIKRKGDFHLFHTVEFHLLVMFLSFFWVGFLFIFIGMVFHSLLDLGYLFHHGYVYRRQYFLLDWTARKLE